MGDDETVKRAVDRIRDVTGFEDGAEIRTCDVWGALGVEDVPERKPKEADRAYVRRCERHRRDHLGIFSALRERLLVVHRVDLQPTYRGHYTIVPRAQQAKKAARDGTRQAKKALRGALGRIEHVDLSKLDADAMRELERAQLNTAALLAMVSRRSPASVLEQARAEALENAEPDSDPTMTAPR